MLITTLPLFLIFIPLIWFFVTTGMTGDRLKIDLDEHEMDATETDNEDEGWKWGIFYYNKKDPSFMVPKRFGGGLTINFANKWGIVI